MTVDQLIEKAIEASILGGEAILEVYDRDFEVDYKEDESPLTEADKAAHNIIEQYLSPLGLPILSEEGKSIPYSERKDWKQFWMVDPLDGTKEFVKRNGEFTVNIALIENGSPIAGVIYVPVTGELYYANSEGAFKVPEIREYEGIEGVEDESIEMPFADASSSFKVIGSRSHMSDETMEYFESLKSEHSNVEVVSKGSSLKLCLVAEGNADEYPRFAPTMEWDTAAGHAIVNASGGQILQHGKNEALVYNKEDLLNPWFLAKK